MSGTSLSTGVNLYTFVGARASTMLKWAPTMVLRAHTKITMVPRAVLSVWATPTVLITCKSESVRLWIAKIYFFGGIRAKRDKNSLVTRGKL